MRFNLAMLLINIKHFTVILQFYSFQIPMLKCNLVFFYTSKKCGSFLLSQNGSRIKARATCCCVPGHGDPIFCSVSNCWVGWAAFSPYKAFKGTSPQSPRDLRVNLGTERMELKTPYTACSGGVHASHIIGVVTIRFALLAKLHFE